jgi:polysaccharide biosynthesis protein PslG
VKSPMSKRMLRVVVSIVCAVSFGAGASAASASVVIGIGDSNTAMFSSPLFTNAGFTTARYIVPWDVVTRKADKADLAAFRAWLSAAAADHVSPLISFGADYTNPAANYVPSVGQYETAVKAFLKDFPQIKTYTAWNEPDFSYRSLARNPGLAANYFNALYVLCHGCTVLAGDVYLPATGQARIDGAMATLGPWLRAYVKGIHHKPSGWALHDYTEIRAHNTSQLKILMSMTSGPIWLDETGGVLRRGHWQYKNQSASAAAKDEQFLLSLPGRYPRITRIYHYQWQADPQAGWDSGLLAANGTPRPAYNVLVDYIKAHAR